MVGNPDLANYALWMQREGYKPSTIKSSVLSLRPIPLREPEEAKQFLANMNICDSRKVKLVYDLARYYKWKGVPFSKPRYKKNERLPYVPLEKDIDQLIGGLRKKLATFCQMAKETGARSGEIMGLRWIDVDLERQLVNIQAEKNSKPRQLKMSSRLIGMLNLIPRQGKYLFYPEMEDRQYALSLLRRNYERKRKRISEYTQNPNIQRISLHTFRHWRASTLYAQTKDILYVKEQLGHRSINSTLVYIQLGEYGKSEDYTVKAAKNHAEATPLIESGFQYVATTPEGIMLFRKRK